MDGRSERGRSGTGEARGRARGRGRRGAGNGTGRGRKARTGTAGGRGQGKSVRACVRLSAGATEHAAPGLALGVPGVCVARASAPVARLSAGACAPLPGSPSRCGHVALHRLGRSFPTARGPAQDLGCPDAAGTTTAGVTYHVAAPPHAGWHRPHPRTPPGASHPSSPSRGPPEDYLFFFNEPLKVRGHEKKQKFDSNSGAAAKGRQGRGLTSGR